ncbi:MAG: 2-amino-4-hydroxy-6-hydroxymethyldihydropteridine diphosphokinase [Wenzhouxiangellaceae bacterium]
MITAFLGLGGNQGDPQQTLSQALTALDRLPGTHLRRWSRPWHTPPWGDENQSAFLNLAAQIDTELSPLPLMAALLDIERALGRYRNGRRWGPRLIDIDLLLYGPRIIRHPRLQVPHPYLRQRAFVLCPLAEIAPRLQLPGGGAVSHCLNALDQGGHHPAAFTCAPDSKPRSCHTQHCADQPPSLLTADEY